MGQQRGWCNPLVSLVTRQHSHESARLHLVSGARPHRTSEQAEQSGLYGGGTVMHQSSSISRFCRNRHPPKLLLYKEASCHVGVTLFRALSVSAVPESAASL
jgi:hypothetical protein